MLYINDWSINKLKKHFARYKIHAHCPNGSWQTKRYIQIYIDKKKPDLHYEYIIDSNWTGRVELHFEGEQWENNYGLLVDSLIDKTQNCDELSWSEWHCGYRCQPTLQKMRERLTLIQEVALPSHFQLATKHNYRLLLSAKT